MNKKQNIISILHLSHILYDKHFSVTNNKIKHIISQDLHHP